MASRRRHCRWCPSAWRLGAEFCTCAKWPGQTVGAVLPNPWGWRAASTRNAWRRLGINIWLVADAGTVTWHAQPGNETTPVSRERRARRLNGLGFNNDGAEG